MDKIKLTAYSHGAGCGCKISPAILEEILSHSPNGFSDPNLLVGNDTKDDAAVYDLGNGTAIISTTDFFMPIVDDPYDFGGIAAANALSDIYAMGGSPLMAIAILGWPLDKLPPQVATQVLNGGRDTCKAAGISLAGGHSIDCPEPIFGLAVTGLVEKSNITRNSTARPDSLLFLTKPLGVGIVTTAEKRGLAEQEHLDRVKESMLKLNTIGHVLGTKSYVSAMTDVTGFGLLGHLTEICESSGLTAHIQFDQVPQLPFLPSYLDQGCVPGGTHRNWESYGHGVAGISEVQKMVLADPQTSGGLLVCVDAGQEAQFIEDMKAADLDLTSFGQLRERGPHLIEVHEELSSA